MKLTGCSLFFSRAAHYYGAAGVQSSASPIRMVSGDGIFAGALSLANGEQPG